MFYSRYTDISVIPEIGWYVTTRSGYTPRRGEHGWNNNAVNMRVSYILICIIKVGNLFVGFYGSQRTSI